MENNNLETLRLENGEYLTTLSDKYRNRKPYAVAQQAVTAAIPGTVMSVLVKEGQSVKRGDALCILDSMKMNNTICTDKSGTVSKIYIKEGEPVAKDALMIEITEE